MDLSTLPTTAPLAKLDSPAFPLTKLQELANQSDASAPWEEMDELLRYRKAGKEDDDIVAMVLKHFRPNLRGWAEKQNLKLERTTITARNPVWAKEGARVAPATGTSCVIIPYPDAVISTAIPQVYFEPIRDETQLVLVDWQAPKLLPDGSSLIVKKGEIKFLPVELRPLDPTAATNEPAVEEVREGS
ncbi:hypothetical protein Purlil1_14122 [Purpureocillium lilacinum]|uniref:Uncharacterized protein n=1 Tax=Purpureocillium lilacinum TaxID=33203 RepID=A0ABR0BC57_PURLI|nr:hypothetical protein Purlil1_14122 [Purpureocillium lilacinum]